MPRPKGAKNKKTIKRNLITKILILFGLGKIILSNKDIFIDEIAKNYLKWKIKGEIEFATHYKMLLNIYTQRE
jgi:hypothetical protein